MASKVPTINVKFRAAAAARDGAKTALMICPIGSGGAASPGVENKVIDADDLAALIGASEGNDAAAAWFGHDLQTDYDLYVQGVDSAGWAAETWEILFTGTATAAGTIVLRYGEFTINVTVAKDDDGDAVATAAAAALTASAAPLAAVVDGITTNQVNVTSDYLGLHTQRFPLSADLYRDRGEVGVEGITTAITPQATGAGEPTFTAPTDDYDLVFHAFRTAGFLDSLETHLQTGWDDRNAYAHTFVALAGSEANLTAFGDTRNDRHTSFVDISDAPVFELTAAVHAIDAVRDAIALEGTPNIGGQRMPISLPAPTVKHDAETILDAGITALRVSRTSVTTVRFVVSYREDDDTNEDLTQFDVGTVLALAEFGDRLVAELSLALGKAIVADGTPLNPIVARNAISAGGIRGRVEEILKGLWRDAIVFAESAEVLAAVVKSITTTGQDGRATGFAIELDPTIVRRVTFLSALVRYF